jgi:hypothetical protein
MNSILKAKIAEMGVAVPTSFRRQHLRNAVLDPLAVASAHVFDFAAEFAAATNRRPVGAQHGFAPSLPKEARHSCTKL